MLDFLQRLEKLGKPAALLIGFSLIGLIGFADYLIGYELASSVFYVLPIALITWLAGRRYGIAASVLSAFVWLAADYFSRLVYPSLLIPVWNTLIRLAFFVIIALLLSALHRALRREAQLARIDYLTGAVNSRFFYELAQMEIERFERYHRPFTLAYIDLDNFKAVNDRLGHATGDQVLRTVIALIKDHTRKTDVVARLGGDEFAILFPETDQEAAPGVLASLQSSLLEEMRGHDWPVTFSIGALTCAAMPVSVDELVSLADDMMYAVKHGGKNAVQFSVYSG